MNVISSRVAAKSLEGWRSLAEEVARSAGTFLADSRDRRVEIVANLGKDVKLSLDRESEQRIVDLLQERSDFSILSEERGTIRGRAAEQEWRWIVDPLDGSLNYLQGIPLCCVSVGLWSGDSPLLGVIYDFDRDELFTGIVGDGAWLNGTAIRVSQAQEQGDAVLCTGFPVGTDFSFSALATLVEQVRHYKKIRLFGSAALSLAYVAAGRADAYYERDIKLWDVAAGMALVLAAGGQVLRKASGGRDALTVYAGSQTLKAPWS